ncbi:hypothetical protein [Bifidobacterium sp.]|uniref:hypothetical protein n=1 Tax=Bifidobacterium sp. TaxID=41200 RepID=UPI003D7DD972
MTIDSIHAIAALCIGIVLIALPWFLPRNSGAYVRCAQCLKYHQACSSLCPACLTPDSTASGTPRYAHILATRTRGMHIQFLLAIGELLICVTQCALSCLIIKGIIGNAGLPTAYGINQNIKLAFVLMLVPTVACWYAFIGSGLRGGQSYSPTRPMVFRRGTPSVVKELLSGLSFAIAQSVLLWFVIRPMLSVDDASAFMLKDCMPLLAYGIGTVCCVILFAISCCVAPCTFGAFRHVPRGGYSINPANGAIEASHESSEFSVTSVLELLQALLDDCLR